MQCITGVVVDMDLKPRPFGRLTESKLASCPSILPKWRHFTVRDIRVCPVGQLEPLAR